MLARAIDCRVQMTKAKFLILVLHGRTYMAAKFHFTSFNVFVGL